MYSDRVSGVVIPFPRAARAASIYQPASMLAAPRSGAAQLAMLAREAFHIAVKAQAIVAEAVVLVALAVLAALQMILLLTAFGWHSA